MKLKSSLQQLPIHIFYVDEILGHVLWVAAQQWFSFLFFFFFIYQGAIGIHSLSLSPVARTYLGLRTTVVSAKLIKASSGFKLGASLHLTVTNEVQSLLPVDSP